MKNRKEKINVNSEKNLSFLPGWNNKWKYVAGFSIIIIIIFISYWPSLYNSFVWDDEVYILKNPLLRSFNLKEIFSKYIAGNYHPITILLLALEYKIFGLNEWGYHVVNLMIHIFNSILVYYVILLLSGKNIVSFVTALLFGIHPMHVESVAWTCELKDLSYTFFFLASYIGYLKYQDTNNKKYYFISVLLFFISLLSKAMAVSLPIVLILTDYFRGFKTDSKSIVKKLPYLILALVFGIVAILAQSSSGATETAVFPIFQRLLFTSYGFIMYLVKLIIPFNLSGYYPYPIEIGNGIPGLYFIFPVLVIILASFIYYLCREEKKILFGLGFFTITIFLVLQLFPVGGAIMADRYSYVPSIGILYLAGEGFNILWSRKKTKNISYIVLSIFVLFFSLSTYARCAVWKNNVTFWSDVIAKSPGAPTAYNYRGNNLMKENRYKEAILDFNKAITIHPNYTDAYLSRANLWIELGKNDSAKTDLDKIILLHPDNAEAYNLRARVMAFYTDYNNALLDFNKAISIKPDYVFAYYNRAVLLMNLKKYDDALKDINKALIIDPDYAEAYNIRGTISRIFKKYDEAESDFNKSIEINPGQINSYINNGALLEELNKNEEAITCYNNAIKFIPDKAELYTHRGRVLRKLKREEEALQDYNKVITLNPDSAEGYLERGKVLLDMKRFDEALIDCNKIIDLNPANPDAYDMRGNILMNLKEFDKALSDYSKAIHLKPDFFNAYNNRGTLFMGLQNYESAINDFSSAIKLQPEFAEAYSNRGSLYGILKKNEVALADFNKSIELQPDYAKTYVNRGIIYKNIQKNKEAISDFTKAINLQADYIKAYYFRGLLYNESGNKDLACKDLQKAVEGGFQNAVEPFNNICK